MLNERQARAWDELALGPQWLRRKAAQPPLDLHPAIREISDVQPEWTMEEGAHALPAPYLEQSVEIVSSDLSLEGQWMQVRQEVSGCRKCALCESRNRTVFGSGPQGARWMLIGEAPGADEDASGEPFVGQAGRLLDQMLMAIGLSRQHDVFITNVLKCRPPGNRNPEPLEAATCSPYLYRQIDLLQPDLILLLGRFAVQSVLKTEASLSGLRRQVHRYVGSRGEIPVVCTYHPAYLLRNLTEKKKSWEDLCLAMDVVARQQTLRSLA